jgi:hypothetical protein
MMSRRLLCAADLRPSGLVVVTLRLRLRRSSGVRRSVRKVICRVEPHRNDNDALVVMLRGPPAQPT